MAPIAVYRLCPSSPMNITLPSLMKCSVHESLHYTINPRHEESVVYFTLLTFCVGLTLFSLVCLEVFSALVYRYLLSHIPAVLQYNPDSISTYRHWFKEEDDDDDDDDDMAPPSNRHGDESDYILEDSEQDDEEPISGICAYCFDKIYDEPIAPCTKCKRVCCADCVRAIFILACRDESSMPPRCCRRPVQLAYGRLVLNDNEVQEFRDKYDEWITAERCYCPVPSCSVFLNPRVFPQLCRGQNRGLGLRQGLEGDHEGSGIISYPYPGPVPSYAFYESDAESESIIHCPQCDAAICLQCMHLAHDNDDRECSRDDDIGPELAEVLVSMRAKRCPKCRAAVRKTHGCGQMRCRCGAKWCWYCFRTVEECEDEPCVISVEGPGLHGEVCSSDESNGDIRENGHGHDNSAKDDEGDGGLEDMIAFRARYIPAMYSQDLSAYGIQNDHPLVTSDADRRTEEECRVVPFNCLHQWYPVKDLESEASLDYDCERCWVQVYADLTDIPTSEEGPGVGLVPVHRDLVADGEINPDYDIMQDRIMFRCWICSQTICNKCRKGY